MSGGNVNHCQSKYQEVSSNMSIFFAAKEDLLTETQHSPSRVTNWLDQACTLLNNDNHTRITISHFFSPSKIVSFRPPREKNICEECVLAKYSPKSIQNLILFCSANEVISDGIFRQVGALYPNLFDNSWDGSGFENSSNSSLRQTEQVDIDKISSSLCYCLQN